MPHGWVRHQHPWPRREPVRASPRGAGGRRGMALDSDGRGTNPADRGGRVRVLQFLEQQV
ncbi:protein of unknown function [Candidatus Bipolaricaulis anaerobius]|uniref:Uncharacterized protein n=1 Tax=Candidatus Bipolaricaulis anaerobius TaxID=2026885 RepID=A0A2X3K4M8_9BACT|nr:protein of unknown function [Candidatus Bipolaricaulis anaerobius]